ncbi:MAG: hypothetical protein WC634_03375 [archaeon]
MHRKFIPFSRVPRNFFSEEFRALPLRQRAAKLREFKKTGTALQSKVDELDSEFTAFWKLASQVKTKEGRKQFAAFNRRIQLIYREILALENQARPYFIRLNVRVPPLEDPSNNFELYVHNIWSTLKDIHYVVERHEHTFEVFRADKRF